VYHYVAAQSSFMTVKVTDAHATVLEGCTTDEQLSVVQFFEQKDSMKGIFIKKCFLLTVGSVCLVQRFKTASRNSFKDVRKSHYDETEVQKWLRQQSKNFCVAGFGALVK
jgi:polyphosphate kinase 2 (PPK2 family)